MKALGPIIEAWQERHKRKAEGGLNAMRGFRYQYLVALNKAVESWLKTPDSTSLFAVEALSDTLLGSSNSRIEISQAKRTGTKKALREALEELWEIHLLSKDVCPEVAAKMVYKVHVSRMKIVDQSPVIDGFTPKGASSDELIIFRSRIEIENTGDPLDELLDKLATKLRMSDPLGFVDQWVGLLVNGSESALTDYSQRLWNELRKLSSVETVPPWCHIWGIEDTIPNEVKPGDVLTGQSPRPTHLRQGHFAVRSQAYTHLYKSFEDWIEEIDAACNSRNKIPIFWISGSSGSGKSIALLHLLAQFHSEGHFPVLWLGNNIGRLPDLIPIAFRLSGTGSPVIAIDDPYSPTQITDAKNIWNDVGAQLQELRDQGRNAFLVCAGPTEQSDFLERDFPDYFQVRKHSLCLYDTPEAVEELKTFFTARTGVQPASKCEEDILLVQRMFQWRIGSSLKEFARRFQKRAQELGLDEWLGTVLSSNRLYVGFPKESLDDLSAHSRDSLLRLLNDHHLSVDDGRQGVWITHPHLGNELFEVWYPNSAPHTRTALTLGACKASLKYAIAPADRTALLWAIERALSDKGDEDIRNRIHGLDLETIIRGAWDFVNSNLTQIPTSLLPVWIGFECRFPRSFRNFSAIECALTHLHSAQSEEVGLRLTAHRLLWHLSEMPSAQVEKVYSAVDALLNRSLDWREWLPITIDLAQRRQSDFDVDRLCSWLEVNLDKQDAGEVASIAIKIASDPAIVRARIDAAVAKAGSSMARAVEILFDSSHGEPISKGALSWLENNYWKRNAAFGLAGALRWNASFSENYARSWLDKWGWAPEANIVYRPWFDYVGTTPDAIRLAKLWVSPDRIQSDRIFEMLLRVCPTPEVKRNAVEWAHNHLGCRGWPFLWTTLWNTSPGDPELVQLGKDSLHIIPEDLGAWTHIWEALWNKGEGDIELENFGFEWLQGASPNHEHWAFVWTALWERKHGEPKLENFGREWLHKAPPQHGSWKYVWEELWKRNKRDVELFDIAKEWLRSTTLEHGSWKFVWEELWKVQVGSAELISAGKNWLVNVPPEHGSWYYLWVILWEYSRKNDPALREIGKEWLKAAPLTHGSWTHTWEKLWYHSIGEPDLVKLGMLWLTNVSLSEPSWTYVWKALWNARQNQDRLAPMGRDWLQNTTEKHPWKMQMEKHLQRYLRI